MKDQLQWAAPSPLWAEAARSANAAVRRALHQPALLRFASDTFMDDFTALLESEPSRLGEYIALPETWRAPAPTPGPTAQAPEFVRKLSNFHLAAGRKLNQLSGLTPAKVIAPGAAVSLILASQAISVAIAAAAETPLKLYQPAHQRFYLVTACLVCGRPGLPDHALRSGRDERVSYVVRRLYQQPSAPARPAEEYAFVTTAQGSGWQKASSPDDLVENEERLPFFAVNFFESDGRRRRLFGGMIPVGKREAYMGAGTFTPATNGESPPNSTPKTARKIHFRAQVTEPWKNLLRTVNDDADTLLTASLADAATREDEKSRLRKESRQSAQTLSWYILLDFVKYLQLYLPRLWPAVLAQSKAGKGLNQQEENLYDALDGMSFTSGDMNLLRTGTSYTPAQFASSMLDALSRMGKGDADPAKLFWEQKLDGVTTPYNRAANPIDLNWPDFLYPLADLIVTVPLPPSAVGSSPLAEEADEGDGLSSAGVSVDLATQQSRVDKLAVLVVRALPRDSNKPAPPPPLASQAVLDTREGTFVIRCVYERPVCGPLDPPLLSEPSALFQMASFFDPDAPARPIRIALPLDTSPAGLRKFDKNTAFMISDQLCGLMGRIKGITFADLVLSVLPWPFHKSLSVAAPEIGPCKNGAGLELGMICTLSIPIITICALILLFVIVLLLDIIFKWIPFFIMCFPLPGFKGKKS
jgi:hypothetical protein